MDLAADPSLHTSGRKERSPAPDASPASLSQLTIGLKAAAGARIHLFELEAQRAAWAVAIMVGLAVAAALLLITAWLIFASGLTLAAVSLGMPWWLGMLLVIALHLVGARFLINRIKSYVGHVSFSASRRTLAKTGHESN